LGTKFDDTLAGTTRANVQLGNNGRDTLIGGAGADKLDGGIGVDYASYQGSLAGVTVNMLTVSENTGDAKGDSSRKRLRDCLSMQSPQHGGRFPL
jgi:serralysin